MDVELKKETRNITITEVLSFCLLITDFGGQCHPFAFLLP